MYEQLRKATVCFIKDSDKVLLVQIEYSPTDRKWNGIGGFAEEGESLEDAVAREVEEETEIILKKDDLKKVAVLNISPTFQLNVFTVEKWSGNLVIKDPTLKELKWFPVDQLPLDQMHKDNDKWLPKILAEKLIQSKDNSYEEVESFDSTTTN